MISPGTWRSGLGLCGMARLFILTMPRAMANTACPAAQKPKTMAVPRSVAPSPADAMIPPAIDGPATRATLNTSELIASADGTASRPTRLVTMTSRMGWLIASTIPSNKCEKKYDGDRGGSVQAHERQHTRLKTRKNDRETHHPHAVDAFGQRPGKRRQNNGGEQIRHGHGRRARTRIRSIPQVSDSSPMR